MGRKKFVVKIKYYTDYYEYYVIKAKNPEEASLKAIEKFNNSKLPYESIEYVHVVDYTNGDINYGNDAEVPDMR